MNQELQQYYNNFFDLFSTEGWKQLLEELNTEYDSLSIESISDQRELDYVKGKIDVISRVVNFQFIIEKLYEQAEEDSLNDSEV